MHLNSLALRDTFRERHPRLRGFTCFSHMGGASRIDQISLSAIGAQVDVVNAGIVWQWGLRYDHDPAVADLRISLPSALAKVQKLAAPSWRALCQAIDDSSTLDSLQTRAARRIATHTAEIEDAMQHLDRVCEMCNRDPYGARFEQEHAALDAAVTSQGTGIRASQEARRLLEAAHEASA